MNLPKRAIVITAILSGTACAVFAQDVSTPPPGPGLVLINERCAGCHPVTQALQARKSRAEWTSTVQAMVDRGAELTPQEEGVVVDYLATNFTPAKGPAAPDGTPKS